MAKFYVETRGGEQNEIDGVNGTSVMQLIRDGGIDELLAICGGSCSCATCHVYIDPEFIALIPPVKADEDDLLECASHRLATSRLSCQISFSEALDGLRLKIAPED